MRRRLEAAGIVGLIAVLSGCAGNELAPLPVRAGETASASTSAGATPSSVSARPTPSPVISRSRAKPERVTQPPRPATKPTTIIEPPEPEPEPTKPTSSCDDAVLVDLDLQNTELALVPSMCFHIGGVLRMHSIGPGLVEATPESLRDYRYEAAVVTLRFLRPGTVTVSIPQDAKTYTIEVVVID